MKIPELKGKILSKRNIALHKRMRKQISKDIDLEDFKKRILLSLKNERQ